MIGQMTATAGRGRLAAGQPDGEVQMNDMVRAPHVVKLVTRDTLDVGPEPVASMGEIVTLTVEGRVTGIAIEDGQQITRVEIDAIREVTG